MVGRAVFCRGRANNDVGTKRFQIPLLFDRNLVRQYEYAFIAADRGHQSEPDSGIAGRGLNYGSALLKNPLLLSPVDHRDTDPILNGVTRIQAFHLAEDLALDIVLFSEFVNPYERRFADETENIVMEFHWFVRSLEQS